MDQIVFKPSFLEDDFVGIKYEKSKIAICFPLGFNTSLMNEMSDKEKKIQILLLLKSISVAKSKSSYDAQFDDKSGDNSEIPFNSFLWMISDYFNNGVFKDIEKEFKQGINSGKINWKRTINSEHYFVNNNVSFINPFHETKQQINDLITELNIYCINKSISYIGFLLGNIKMLASPLNDEVVEKYKGYYIDVINKELMRSFNDRKKILLNHMKRIISFTFTSDLDKNINYGTRKYETVWEIMVNECFGSTTVKISDYFPESYWTIFNNDRVKDSSKLRPDTILKDCVNNKLYILDAKYYKFGITKRLPDLPHTDSIQKQITYAEHIITNNDKYGNISSNNIYNAFIIPYDKDDSSNQKYNLLNNLEYCGFAESDWKEHSMQNSYEKIALILVDFKYLLNCFFKKDIPELNLLMEKIERVSTN